MTRYVFIIACFITTVSVGMSQDMQTSEWRSNDGNFSGLYKHVATRIVSEISEQYTGTGQSVVSPSYSGEGEEILLKAMNDELRRNMDRLRLEELKPPFFISYEVRDYSRTLISATLGSLIISSSNHTRSLAPRVMVGSYERNDENFLDISGSFGMSGFSFGSGMPMENDYYGIRRAIWGATDNLYKSAADTYEKKIAAIEQQNLKEDIAGLPDFSKENPETLHVQHPDFAYDRSHWEQCAKDVSAVFKYYPDIQSSRVVVTFVDAKVFFVNSEGTNVSYPITLAALQMYAHTQAADGTILNEQAAYYGKLPQELPNTATATTAAEELAESLLELQDAQPFADTYTGPVLVEGQAVAELISQRLFMDSDGLIATRDQISSSPGAMSFMGSSKSLGDRIGKRILAKELSIAAIPQTEEHSGVTLIGAYSVDREGVVPPDRLMLVEEGTLKTLLNDRIPSKEVLQSNGHDRIGTNQEASIAPGVIHLFSEKPSNRQEMKARLIETAKDEGLEYAFIVRKISSPTLAWEEEINPEALLRARFSGGDEERTVRQPILVYKVDVETGEETLIRSVTIGGISLGALRDILAAEDNEYVYNTLTNPSSGGNMGFILRLAGSLTGASGGFPSTFIVPNSLLFEELEIKQIDRVSTPKLPIVQSPLSKN